MTSPRTQYVTPSLFIGEPPALSRVAVVQGSQEALAAIRAGMVAVLPAGAHEAAQEVLRALGASPVQVSARLRFAKTASL